MKRNDCIRLSLRVFGIEVGLMEFTPEEVLIVDRYNKQYVRARYEEVAFLHEARIDFYALQALFWNEIFAPGIGSRTPEAKQFDASLEAGNVQLVSQKTGTLRYAFLTPIENARIERLTVTAARGDDPTQFVWKYDDFAKLGKRLFPTRMEMSLTSPKTSLGLTLRLSSLKEESGWPLRTTVSNKYQRRTVEEVLKGLHL